jgi:acyl-CoA thioester hydrolase
MADTSFALTSERHVYIGDDDASGLIYFNSYFQYMAEADQDFFRAVGQPLVESIRDGVSCPCVKAECSYIRPVRAGDDITHITTLERPGRSSFRMVHRFYLNGELAAEGVISRVWTDLTAMNSMPLPQWLRALSSSSEE